MFWERRHLCKKRTHMWNGREKKPQGIAEASLGAPMVTGPCARSAGQWWFQDDSRLGLRWNAGWDSLWVSPEGWTLNHRDTPQNPERRWCSQLLPGTTQGLCTPELQKPGGTDGCGQQTPLPRGLRAWLSQTAHGTAPLMPNSKWLPAVGRGCPPLLCPPHSPAPLGGFLLISNRDKGRDPVCLCLSNQSCASPWF